jgi:hypothetical protein
MDEQENWNYDSNLPDIEEQEEVAGHHGASERDKRITPVDWN